jgi:hypothetical protein
MRATVLMALLASGCNMFGQAQAGYLAPTSTREGHTGVAVDLRIDSHTGGETLGFGGGGGFRTKFAPDLFQISVAEELFAVAFPHARVSPYARAGMNFLQFEGVDGEFGFGMFSPYGEAGVMVEVRRSSPRSRLWITFGAAAEYDLRFTDQANQGYVLFVIGVAGGGSAGARARK